MYKTALYMLPLCIGGILTNVIAAMVASRVSGRILMIFGLLTFCIATLLGALQSDTMSYWPMDFPAMGKEGNEHYIAELKLSV